MFNLLSLFQRRTSRTPKKNTNPIHRVGPAEDTPAEKQRKTMENIQETLKIPLAERKRQDKERKNLDAWRAAVVDARESAPAGGDALQKASTGHDLTKNGKPDRPSLERIDGAIQTRKEEFGEGGGKRNKPEGAGNGDHLNVGGGSFDVKLPDTAEMDTIFNELFGEIGDADKTRQESVVFTEKTIFECDICHEHFDTRDEVRKHFRSAVENETVEHKKALHRRRYVTETMRTFDNLPTDGSILPPIKEYKKSPKIGPHAELYREYKRNTRKNRIR
jgi:hypothetical protein